MRVMQGVLISSNRERRRLWGRYPQGHNMSRVARELDAELRASADRELRANLRCSTQARSAQSDAAPQTAGGYFDLGHHPAEPLDVPFSLKSAQSRRRVCVQNE
jgi:hypothetical protein